MTYTDIILPKNNEIKFLEVAIKLGYNKLIFAYKLESTKKNDIKKQLEKIKAIIPKTNTECEELKFNLIIESAILISSEDKKKLSTGDLQNIKKVVDHIIFDASSENDLRTIAKNKHIDMITKAELNLNNDFMHQRNGGLDSVICRIAKENNTKFGFLLSDMVELRNKRYIGRAAQNMMICKKYGSSIIIASFASKPSIMKGPKDIISLVNLIQLDKKTSRLGMKGIIN